jgi:hypothetical protein
LKFSQNTFSLEGLSQLFGLCLIRILPSTRPERSHNYCIYYHCTCIYKILCR